MKQIQQKIINYLVSNYANRVDDILQTLGEEFVEYIQQENCNILKHIHRLLLL